MSLIIEKEEVEEKKKERIERRKVSIKKKRKEIEWNRHTGILDRGVDNQLMMSTEKQMQQQPTRHETDEAETGFDERTIFLWNFLFAKRVGSNLKSLQYHKLGLQLPLLLPLRERNAHCVYGINANSLLLVRWWQILRRLKSKSNFLSPSQWR